MGLISCISDFLGEKAGKISKKFFNKGFTKVKSDLTRSPVKDCFESASQEICSDLNKIQIDLKNFNLKKILKSLVDENGNGLLSKVNISAIKRTSKYYGTSKILPEFIKNLIDVNVFDQKQLAKIIKELGNSKDLSQHSEVLKELVKAKSLIKNADSEVLEWFVKQKTNYALSFDKVAERKSLLKMLNSVEEMSPGTEKPQRLVNRLGSSGINKLITNFNIFDNEKYFSQYEELLKAFSKNKDIDSSVITNLFEEVSTPRLGNKQELIEAKTLFINLFNGSKLVKNRLDTINLKAILSSINNEKQAKGKLELLNEIFKIPNSKHLNSESINCLVVKCFDEEGMASNLDFAKNLLNLKKLAPENFNDILYYSSIDSAWNYAQAPSKIARLSVIKFLNEMQDLPPEKLVSQQTLKSIIEYNSEPEFAQEYIKYFKAVTNIKGLDAQTFNDVVNPRNFSFQKYYTIKNLKSQTDFVNFMSQNLEKCENIDKYVMQKILNEIETTEDVNLVKDFINITHKLNFSKEFKQNQLKNFNSVCFNKFLDEINIKTTLLKKLDNIIGLENTNEKLLQKFLYHFLYRMSTNASFSYLNNPDEFFAALSKLKNNSGEEFQEILKDFLVNELKKPLIINALTDLTKKMPLKEQIEKKAFEQIFIKNNNFNIYEIKSKIKFLEYIEKFNNNENMSENFILELLKGIKTDESINSFSKIIERIVANNQIQESDWYKIISGLNESKPNDVEELFNIKLDFFKTFQAKNQNNLIQMLYGIKTKQDAKELSEALFNIEKYINLKDIFYNLDDTSNCYLKDLFYTLNKKNDLITFNKLISVEKLKNNSELFNKIWNQKDILLNTENIFDIDYCVFARNSLTKLRQDLDSKVILELEQVGININAKIKKIEQFLNKAITPIEVPIENIRLFGKNFLANYPQTENILKTFDFTVFEKDGLPLKYSRKSFMADLSQILKKETPDERLKIIEKMSIQPKFDETGNIFAYEGIPNLKDLMTENDTQRKILELTRKFMFENEVVSQNPELNKSMNSVIKAFPEYLNFIGKQQQATHAYSTDIHIMKVLQEAMNHPEYSKLSDLDKIVMKFSILFHDIAKTEGIIDKQHPNVSALYTNNLLEKIKMPKDVKDRIVELVKNHHWLEEFNTNYASAENIATRFRNPQDYLISKIFAEADLKGVNKDFYSKFSSSFLPEKLAPIEKALDEIYQTGNIIITSRIITPSKIPQITHQGKAYQVINLSNIPETTEMSPFGFIPGTKKQDLRFLTHFIPESDFTENAQKIDLLSDIARPGVLSTSVLSPQRNKTYCYRKYGFILESSNSNIANAYDINQGSGFKKDFSNFVQLTTNQNSLRTFLSKNVIQELSLKYPDFNEAEYGEVYKQIVSKKHLGQISDLSTGKRKIKGEDLKQALSRAQDKLFNPCENEHNEIVVYNPKISGMIFKKDRIQDVPQELLDFAHEKNLPVVLLGES